MEQERIRNEEIERKQRQQKNIDDAVKATGAVVGHTVKIPDQVENQIGSVHFRTVRKWRIKNRADIPSHFWMLDEKAINEEMRKNRPITGIEYYEEKTAVAK